MKISTQWILILLGSIISYFVITTAFVRQVQIDGNSMSPTLKNSERVLFNPYWFTPNPKGGDIVVFKDPLRLWLGEKNQGYSIKRVIATENQTVCITNGNVYVDGNKLQESYLPPNTKTLGNPNVFVYPTNQCFVLGDNRNDSVDSRYFGSITVKNIVGKL